MVLVGRDRRTGVYFSHAVPHKGAGLEWVAQQMVRDVAKCGYYGRVILKGDQEPALQDLFEDVARRRGTAPTVLECSAVGESQANGFAERAVRSIEEIVRTLKLDLESRLAQRIPIEHPAVAWLIEHGADVLNKTQVGQDGRTPYERLKGKKYGGSFLEFGAQVMLKVSGQVQGGLMQERWVDGTWLGMRFSTQEHLVARSSDGVVVRTRAVRETPRKVAMEDLDKIVGLPHAPQGVAKFERFEVPKPSDVREPPPAEPSEQDCVGPIPRSIRITKEMLDKHGYCQRCPKCRAMLRGAPQGTLGHSAECRKTMMEKLKEDPDYREKLEETENRKIRYLAEELEREDRKRKVDVSDATQKLDPNVEVAPEVERKPGLMGGSSSSSSWTSPVGGTGTMSQGVGSNPPGGEKRKASEAPDGEHLRAEERDRGDELPVPEASPDVEAQATVADQVAPHGSGEKRPREEEGDAAPEARRARLEVLCGLVHGDQTKGDNEDESSRELDLLIAAVSRNLVVTQVNGDAQEKWESSEDFEAEWTPWWQRKSSEQVPKELTQEQVLAAKKVELDTFAQRGVYKIVSRANMEAGAIKLSAKWVVTNKGTEENPKPKARLVAREFVSDSIDRDTLFSGTPGLPVARTLISKAATSRSSRRKRKIMLMDVTAAFLYGWCERPLYMDIPLEDPASQDPTKIAKLVRSLYGTRDAPQLWGKHVARTLADLGYVESKGMPGIFFQPVKGTEIALHVDDFLVVGDEEDLIELRDKLRERYEMKATIVGPEEGDLKEGEFLGRTIRYKDWGIEVEGNAKHVRALLRCVGMEECRTVTTPMLAEDYKNDVRKLKPQERRLLNRHDARLYRRGTALAVYISQDRPDISAAACKSFKRRK